MSEKKKLPIGVSDFAEIIKEGYYLIDKSFLIKEIINDASKIILLPRPRRFGKTLNMSMLKYFFERQPDGSNHCELFQELAIWREPDCRNYCGQYPVIFLTFKDVKMTNYAETLRKIKKLISELFQQHQFLVAENTLNSYEKNFFEKIMDMTAEKGDYEDSLRKLSEYLTRFYQKRAIIIIDEYDTPIQSAYHYRYFEELMPFIRNLFCGGLKDNENLEKGILTGILRVAKENIFSGLNNPNVATILDLRYSEYFGFTAEEVAVALNDYPLAVSPAEIKRWYNGYLFGETVIYNPWSIINALYHDRSQRLKPYWVNTSSNDLIYELITRGGAELKNNLELLIQGETIEKTIVENIVYHQIEKDSTNVWSLLLFSGYLKVVASYSSEDEGLICHLAIPNNEVRLLYRQIIKSWFSESIYNDKYELLKKSLISNDLKTFEKILKEFVLKTFSYFVPTGSESEKVYHAFVLGLLISLNDQYEVKSNRESGYGRYDVMIIPREPQGKTGYLFEFKKVEPEEGEDLEKCAAVALEQIQEKQYATELKERGVSQILEIGVAFEGKKVLLRWRPRNES